MTSYEPVSCSGPGIDELLVALRWVNTNGEAECAQLHAADVTDASSWFRTQATEDPYGPFADMLGSHALRLSLPMLWQPWPGEALSSDPWQFTEVPQPGILSDPGGGFRQRDADWTLTLGDWFASRLTSGGAYRKFEGSAAQAQGLGAAAPQDLLADRYGDFEAYTSHDPWAPWFHDVAWDVTLVLVDRAKLEVTLLCLTATD